MESNVSERLYSEGEKSKRGIHSKQGAVLRFYTMAEHNHVIQQLREMLGEKFDNLMEDVRMSRDYKEIFYYVESDNECKFSEDGECVGHKEIKNYLAHGYIPKKSNLLNN